ncbi:MAG: M20/M25/M40 family metallo-hydrolase [Ardenticatenaceae bacterium]|nr:M20/M25/M40 family metallo-hydrolase [Ardenticatenaceae bacterium]
MKAQTILLLALVALLSGLASVTHAQNTPLATSEQLLITINNPDSSTRLPHGVTLFAHTNGRSGTTLIAGTSASHLAALTAAGFTYQLLEPIPTDATYYLFYPLPGQTHIPPTQDIHSLLHDENWQLLRATPSAAHSHIAAGLPLQPITFDPKPWPMVTAVPRTTAIDPNPIIQNMMDQVITNTVYLYDGSLSGLWPVTIGGSPYTIATRHTNSGTPIQKATQFVGEHFTNLGLAVEYHQWSGATYPNVIATIPGQNNPDEIYILSAHLDDMPAGALAPGADDNASGVVAAMIAADIFSQYQWDCTIRFGIWTGEEQGLNGSHAYAQRAFNDGDNIAAVLNLDMIAWNTPNSSRDIDLHANSSMPATLEQAQLVVDVINAYNLNLIPEIKPNGSGASDHASFWQYGYTAILGIEDFSDFNPYYHTTNDLLSHADLDYFTEFVRASIGSFAHMTGCLIADDQGYLDGQVTAQNGGTPLADATVNMAGLGGKVVTAVTDPTGYYTHPLAIGTYTVTAQAYGYLPVTIPGVTIITNTTTTQNFTLPTAPRYTISGTVTTQDTGQPLAAHITFADTPISVDTEPTTGYYSATLPAGEYIMRVTAVAHHAQERAINLQQSQTQNFILTPFACILLVDDDNNAPDVRPYYTAALDNLGAAYDIFDVGEGDGPTLDEMLGYQTIIWFSGDKYGTAGPNSTDETNLAAYLSEGGTLFLSSQDYLYDMGITSFGQTYLGVASFTNDQGNATTKYGVPGDPIGDGLGPFTLSYPAGFTDYGDIITAGSGSSLAFRSSAAGGNGLDVDKAGSNWKTVFFATSWVPLAHANAANGAAVLQRILNWFDACLCEPVAIAEVITEVDACTVDFYPIYSGELPLAWAWSFPEGTPASSSNENPQGIDFALSGTYAYTVTASNCGGQAVDLFTSEVTVSCDVCAPITAVSLQADPTTAPYIGDSITFTATITPAASTLPYSYTVFVDQTAVMVGQTSDNPLLLNYTFTNSGLFTVTVEVWNCSEATAVSDTIALTILTPPSWQLHLPLIRHQE